MTRLCTIFSAGCILKSCTFFVTDFCSTAVEFTRQVNASEFVFEFQVKGN
jgi:hypothetical protein